MSLKKLLTGAMALALASASLEPAFASQQTIGVGTTANDGTGDPLRTAFQKTNSNFTETYGMEHPGYIAGRWYLPVSSGALGSGANLNNLTVALIPFIPKRSITVDQFAARVTTASSGGNFQIAIYASNTSTLKPTGTPLGSTASGSTTSGGNISVSLGANVSLSAGVLYWIGAMADNTTAVFVTTTTAGPNVSSSIGSATLGSVFGGNGNFLQYYTAPFTTFGTWPDLTSATFSEGIGNNSMVPAFHVLSVP